jgi:tetratricopeptide (TPR) repeat protein
MMLRACAVLLLTLVLPSIAAAQTPAPAADYAQEPFVIERLLMAVAFEADGSRTEDVELRARVQSAAGLQDVGTLTVPYSRDLDTLDIEYVRVRKPDGTIVATPVTTALEVPADLTRQAPTYTDVYFKHINVQGLAVGDTVEYATHRKARSLIPGQFWMEQAWLGGAIVLDQELRVSVPVAVHATVKSANVQPAVTTAGAIRTYTWHHANLTHLSDNDAAVREYANRNVRADVQVTSFSDWVSVGDAVRALWEGRADVTPAIAAKARELTAGAVSDRDKVRAIFGYVSSQVRYVAVSLGVGRIQPHTASEVLTNGFGDCKDKHTLLAALLRAAGIAADPVLIGPGDPFDRDVPSLAQFDHVITFAPDVDGGLWMDATIEVAPPGLLAMTERDHDALRIPPAGAPVLVHTAAEPSRETLWTTDVAGVLDAKGTLTATVKETFSGDIGLLMRAAFRAAPPARWAELVGGISIGHRFGGTATDVHVTAPEETAAPFELTYRYSHESFSGWKTGQIRAALPSSGIGSLPDDRPSIPLEIGVAHIRSTSRIELPAGYEASLDAGVLPDTALHTDFADYHLHNALSGGVFETTREITTKVKELAVDQVAAYGAFVATIGGTVDRITLRQVKPWTWGDTATIDWYGGAPPAVLTTMRAAVDASNRQDHQNASSLIDGLAAANPDIASVGVLRGWIQFRSGAADRGIATIREQMARTPTSSGYKQLGFLLRDDHRPSEAIDAWQQGVDAFPDDRELPLVLADALVAQHRYADALPLLVAQEPRQGGSGRLLWNLGKAYLGAGQPTLALATFARAAEADPTPATLNQVAWEMVEAKIGLEAATGYAERAVRETEEAAAKTTLATLDTSALRRMSALASYWDTLAWAHFRRNDLAVAEQYLQPGWDLMQQGIYAEHLAEIAEASGDHDTAAAYYARALAVDRPEASAAARLQALVPDDRARRALVTGVMTAIAREETPEVPRIPSVSGGAEAFVQVGPDGAVEDVKFVRGDAAMRPAVEMLRAVKMPSRLPPGSSAHLIRRGLLRCLDAAPSCTFTLMPAGRATSVN